MRQYIYILLILIISGSLLNTACQTSNRASKAVKENEERQEAQAERQREEYQKKKERHMSIQTKETKERMEEMQKKSERYNYNKKKFFLLRWWEKLFKKRKPGKKPQPAGH